jgi:hypothetical protein
VEGAVVDVGDVRVELVEVDVEDLVLEEVVEVEDLVLVVDVDVVDLVELVDVVDIRVLELVSDETAATL